jgi:peptidyl-prolyl cis-trans isomerase C
MLFRAVLVCGLFAILNGCDTSSEVIAKVGSKSIDKKEFEAYMNFKRVNAKDESQVSAHLEQYLGREALALAIEKSDILNKENIQIELNEFKKEMLISRYFEAFLKEKVSETAIRNYYSTNAKQFESKKVKVAHVLIRTHKNMSEAERKAKYTKAHEAYSKLKADGQFVDVVKTYSEDTISAKKEGVIGWVSEGAIDPVFSNKVFSEIKAGEMSEPFESSFGFHIVKVLEGPSVVKKPYENVKGDIRHQLRKMTKDAEMSRLQKSIEIVKS